MEIIKFPNEIEFQTAIDNDEPLLVLVSFDGERIIACQIDEAVEHHILLKKQGSPAAIVTPKVCIYNRFTFPAPSKGACTIISKLLDLF